MNCPSCGTANPEGAQFCGNCGTRFEGAAGAPTEAVPPVAPIPPTPIPPVPPPPPPVAPGGTDPTFIGGMPPSPPVADPTAAFPAVPPAGPPPGPPFGAAGPPAGPPPAQKKSKKALLFGLLALLLVAAAVGSFLVLGGDDDEDAGGQVVLEPIGLTLRDDFAGNLDLANFQSSIANSLPGLPPVDSGIEAVLSALRADGDTPGLYGGSRDTGTCDVEQLIDFLTDDANADKAEAWAEVHGIEVDEIEDFVRSLTPVRLRFDTRVTNHGFVDGEANGFQSILEAGTAVLVDDEGVPRVKCNCGNPLTEPEEAGDVGDDEALDLEALAQNPDDAWEDFDPEQVVVVEAGDQLDELVLVDIDSGELFARPVGTDGDADGDVDPDEVCDDLGDSPTCTAPPEATTTTAPDATTTTAPDATTTTVVLGTGDVQVTLEWNSNADLDLAVTDPTQETIDFGNRGPTATGGQLDVDSNVGCPANTRSGIENVFWPPGGAPAGPYTVQVTGFSVDDASRGCGGGDYVLTIRVAGQADQVIQDSVAEGEVDTFDFTV